MPYKDKEKRKEYHKLYGKGYYQTNKAFAPENHILLTIEEHKEIHKNEIPKVI